MMIEQIRKVVQNRITRCDDLQTCMRKSVVGNQIWTQFSELWYTFKNLIENSTLSINLSGDSPSSSSSPMISLPSSSNNFDDNSLNSFKNFSNACDQLRDRVWECLNIGHWKSVREDYRIMYASICLMMLYLSLVIFMHEHLEASLDQIFLVKPHDSFKALSYALSLADMGLIMSPPIMENILADIASVIHQNLILLKPINLSNELQMRLSTGVEISTIKIKPEHRITELICPDIMQFKREYFEPQIPVVISDTIDHWPCLSSNSTHKWSIDYLIKLAGYRTVSIEIGSKYTDECWSQKMMTIQEFVENHFVDEVHRKGYLAQQDLFTQVKELAQDFSIPDYCSVATCCNIMINAWFGPWSTVSPLHQDPYDNLLSQVIGCKYVRLYSNKINRESIYAHQDKLLDNTSQVDLDDYDSSKYPQFSSLPYTEHILKPGQMLFIPNGYWHYVKSLSASFSINFWWI
ncbi:lysine-specific demethylase 8-like [Brevipalpus obovatus]|uniref:lysine-specific demethylase 8-like n=1 Tax=Brevipalpus obovatus TaxID=246614 RepID=UPI003D9F3196